MTRVQSKSRLDPSYVPTDKKDQKRSKQSGRSWGPISILSSLYPTTKKVIATMAAKCFSLVPIYVASGHRGTLLWHLGLINRETAGLLNKSWIDFRIKNPITLSIAKIFEHVIGRRVADLREIIWSLTPNVRIKGHNLSKLFVATTLEELVCRGLIQRVALPALSKALPKPVGTLLNHGVTRILLSSLIFAFAHASEKQSEHTIGILPQFFGGIVYGCAAELDNSLAVPILAHFLFDFMIGGGKIFS